MTINRDSGRDRVNDPPGSQGRFSGQVVLVTGGARNIGLAIAARFAREGAIVALNGEDSDTVHSAVQALTDEGLLAYPFPADVSDAEAVTNMIGAIIKRLGRLDVLVNNAAVPMAGRVGLLALTVEDWERSFAVNARGMFLCTTAAARAMSGGAVVSISSIGATRAHRHAVAYDATKGAVEAATRAMALELAPLGIRVNAVAPGAVINDRFEALSLEEQRSRAEPIPLGRVGTGDDIAAAVAFLSSPDAQYITGQILTVDGGLVAQSRPATTELVPGTQSEPTKGES